MNTQKTTDGFDTKVVYAEKGPDAKVFTRINTGEYLAKLYDIEVFLQRKRYDHWDCIQRHTGKLLGSGPKRNDAMREAFYNLMESKGYSAVEADRLDWILTEQPYRSYGGHKKRKKTVNIEKPVEKVVSINYKKEQENTQMEIDNLFKKYKTAFNEKLGGYFFYEKSDDGKIVGGRVYGPYIEEEEMFSVILEHEAKKADK